MEKEKIWLDAMKGEDGKFSDRVLSDECERFFWKNFLNVERNTRKDEYSKVIEKEVLHLLSKHSLESVLEIGPGWGNYTFSLSKLCKKLFCLDISEDVLELIGKEAKKRGIANIQTIQSKWEDAEASSYDAVFAYNCFYRMRDITQMLRKIDASSKKIAIIGMNSEIDRPCLLEIERECRVRIKKSKLHHGILREILLELGIVPREIVRTIYREYVFDDLQQAMDYEKRFILDDVEDELRAIVEKHYRYRDGKYVQSHFIKAGLLFWEKMEVSW